MALRSKIENGIVYSPYPDVPVPEMSVYAYVKRSLQKYGDSVAAIEGDNRTTYNDLLSGIDRYAAALQSLGIGPGDKVCVHVGHKFEYFMVIYGIFATGATAVCGNPSLTTRELLYQMRDSDSTFALTDAPNAYKVAEASTQYKLKGLLAMDDVPGFVNIQDVSHHCQFSYKEVEVNSPKEDVVAIIYTSGTTGLPKGVQITHYSFAVGIATAEPCFALNERDILLATSPVTNSSGFMYTMICLTLGVTCVIVQPRASVQEFVDEVKKNKVSAVFTFPTVVNRFVDVMEKTGMRTPTIKSLGVGGSSVTSVTAEKIIKIFDLVSFRNSYSLTEAGGMVAVTPPGVIAQGTIGFLVPMARMKIVDMTTGRVLGPNEKGEMLVKMPSVMKGYYNKPEATAEVLSPDGWLRTGDSAYYDEMGMIYYVARLKEMIKCLDTQVPPTELEELLLTHQAVAEAAVVGIPDPKYGEAPTAYIVLKPDYGSGSDTLKQQLKDIISRQCADNKHLYGGVYFVDKFPRTDTGKVQKSALRKGLVDRH